MSNDGKIGETIIVNNGWEADNVYTKYDWLVEGTRLYVCNVDGIQITSFASNLSKWDIIPLGDSDKLVVAATGLSDTATTGVEYISPEQQGGVYGTIYRQYHGLKATTEVVATVGIATLVAYQGRFDTIFCYSGYTEKSTLTIDVKTGTDEVIFTLANVTTLDEGWIDYTKS